MDFAGEARSVSSLPEASEAIPGAAPGRAARQTTGVRIARLIWQRDATCEFHAMSYTPVPA
jgi:hypothetical protein